MNSKNHVKKQNILIHDDQHQYLVVIASDNQVLTIDSFSLNFLWQCWWDSIAGGWALRCFVGEEQRRWDK